MELIAIPMKPILLRGYGSSDNFEQTAVPAGEFQISHHWQYLIVSGYSDKNSVKSNGKIFIVCIFHTNKSKNYNEQ